VAALSVAVVGAGIGGLTAALALAGRGHDITLIERRTGFAEVGAGIQLSPNASRVLAGLGLGAALRRAATEPTRVVIRDLRSGRAIGEVALGSFIKERFEVPYWVIRRGDLQTILLDAVRSRPNIRLLLGRKVAGVENGVAATLAMETASGSAETMRADAVIGADGVWSAVRTACGDGRQPVYQGYAAWRATVPREIVPAEFTTDETGLWLGPKGHVVHYPVGGGRLLNIVAFQPRGEPLEGWAAPGDGSELLKTFPRLAPSLEHLLALPSEWLLWSLFDLPVRRMAQGRIALLGDAAHPVLPFLAQGGALAIEDAATLAAMLPGEADVPASLKRYERARLRRVSRIQAAARRNGSTFHAGAAVAFARNLVIRSLGAEGMAKRYAWVYSWRPPAA
jgi:salicylate hydroxylase